MTESRIPPAYILEKNKALEEARKSALDVDYSNTFCRNFNDTISDICYSLNSTWKDDYSNFYCLLREIFVSFDLSYERYSLFDALSNMRVDQKEDSGLITFYPTLLDIWKGKRVEMKPGKFLRFLFPYLKDTEVEPLVAELKALNQVPEFELIVSQEESAFIEAYTQDYLPKRSPRFNNGEGYYLKRLDSSCMQGKWKPEEHPARVYASGDFWIAYTKEKNTGKIGSRVIYTEESASNIYTVDDKASEILVNHLKENNINNRAEFEGKKIKRIPYEGEDYRIYTPYIDGYSYLSKLDDSFMVIGSDNKDTGIYCNETCGFTYEIRLNLCYCCDEGRVCNSRVLDSYHDIRHVCDSCIENYYVYSDELEAYIDTNTATIHPENPDDFVTHRWLSRNDYVKCEDDKWRQSDECAYVSGLYYPLDSDEIEEFEGEYYLKDDSYLTELKRGKGTQKIETWAFQWIRENNKNSWGERTPYLEYTCETVEVLRDNYEIDENGIAVRLPELPGLELV